MPSCSNSSNILASMNTFSVTQGGSRLIVTIPVIPGLTAGDVVRYDIASSGYTASQANNPANSEVFGVIESIEAPNTNVVIYGSISINSSKLVDMGSGGGSGGNDIYFLSGVTAGKLQNLAPDNLDHIVKPIYQISPHGAYTGVVVNYLGYKISGEIEAQSLNGEAVGVVQNLIGDSSFDDGFVDASISHELLIEDYPEFYSKFSTSYGYVEKLTVSASETIPGSVTTEKSVIQSASTYTGKVGSVDYAGKKIYVVKPPLSSLASTNKKIQINGTQISITGSEIYSIYTPKIRIAEPLIIQSKDGSSSVTQQVKVGIKVKPTQSRVSIPNSVTTTSLSTGSLFLGASGNNVSTILTTLISDVANIKQRLMM